MKFSQCVLFVSGVISALLIATVYQAPIVAQGTSLAQLPQLGAQELVVEPIEAEAIAPANPRAPAREHAMIMPLTSGSVSVHLVNNTPNSITYQALGDTEPRSLDPNEDIMLPDLQVPTTVTFTYRDVGENRPTGIGFIKADLRANALADMLDLIVTPTDNPEIEVGSLMVESTGKVYLM